MENYRRRLRAVESTQTSGSCVRESEALRNEGQSSLGEDSYDFRAPGNESRNDTTISVDLDATFNVQRPVPMKYELHGLNHRLISYMDRVKQNETFLAKAETERQIIRDQLEKHRDEHSKQIETLRSELDEHVRKTVTAEEKLADSEKVLQNLRYERKTLEAELSSCRKRSAGLERVLLSERNEIREARGQIAELRDDSAREARLRSEISDEFIKLKVEYAKLRERMKITSLELTMQESKVYEAEKKLQYSPEDVRKEVQEQRARLEKRGMEKLAEIQQNYAAEILRLNKEHQRDKRSTLLTYVRLEDHAKVDTQMSEYAQKLSEAEVALRDRERKLRDAEENIASLRTAHQKDIAKERRRRERLDEKLTKQEKSQDDIRQELENYRSLIESLDVDGNLLPNYPLGVKRTLRTLASTPDSQAKKSESSSTPLIEVRKILPRIVLTPVRRAPSSFLKSAGVGMPR